jgi:hypothetical protein
MQAVTPIIGASEPQVRLPFYRKLYVQVLAAICLGALLGHLYPDIGSALKPLGDGVPSKRSGHTLTLMSGSSGLLFGGIDLKSPPGPNADLYAFEIGATGAWLADRSTARAPQSQGWAGGLCRTPSATAAARGTAQHLTDLPTLPTSPCHLQRSAGRCCGPRLGRWRQALAGATLPPP